MSSIVWMPGTDGESFSGLLPGGLYIFIAKYRDGWHVNFGVLNLPDPFASEFAAQKAGEDFARRILTECLVALSEE